MQAYAEKQIAAAKGSKIMVKRRDGDKVYIWKQYKTATIASVLYTLGERKITYFKTCPGSSISHRRTIGQHH